MAVLFKSAQQIEHLRAAGRIVAQTFAMLRAYIVPGVSTAQLDSLAEHFIRDHGALPTYKGYGGLRDQHGQVVRPPFPASICVAVNEVICHGMPSSKQLLRDGDIIGVDIGASFHGWVGDACYTYGVGTLDPQTHMLLDATRQSLALGIAEAWPGTHLGAIGAAIQRYAEAQGFGVVREYGGHGVGRSLHEDPFVQHVGEPYTGLRIQAGMVFTIEPMLNAGTPDTRVLDDRWTVVTADGSRSAQFEHTVAITTDGPEILTLP